MIEVRWDPIEDDADDDLNYFRADFSHFVDADQFTKIDNDSATACGVVDGAPLKFTLTNSGVDNAQVSIKGTTEGFTFSAGTPIWIRVAMKLS